jgi:predicted phosphodiesterase
VENRVKRLFATADLHADFADNWTWLRQVAPDRDAGLIIAGDIAHRMDVVEATLRLLQQKFARLFFVPGNHDLWVKPGAGDSLQKFTELVALCDRIDVATRPEICAGTWVLPLFSWYDTAFVGGQPQALPKGWADQRYCLWPETVGAPDRYFAGLNRTRLAKQTGPVVSFSHFMPRADLLPDASVLRFKQLPRVAGSALIESQLRQADSILHFFGHTHIPCDREISDVRYIQHGLGYPRERRQRSYSFIRLV